MVCAGLPAALVTGGALPSGHPAADQPLAHDESEGFPLQADTGETVRPGSTCTPGAPERSYRLAAIGVDITLNRYLDHDPLGEMYVLEDDLPRVRAEEAANAAARAGNGQPAVSVGLGDDAIQPLTLRVRQGECLRLHLHNLLPRGEAASLHLHGSALQVAGASPSPAVVANPAATVAPGASVDYEWMVSGGERTGTYYFHSHALERPQTDHGLFGAVIVESADATWSDPATARTLVTGWAAVVSTPAAGSFREFVLYYHEIGDENYQLLNRSDSYIPLVDPTLGDYRPAARALNYRSEPFMNRVTLQEGLPSPLGGHPDESLAYSSYAFGDPATPILRSYLGDRVVQRVVHAGSEVLHVHHVHGGSIRWHRQPGIVPAEAPGLNKHPPLLPGGSDLTDAQSLAPSETFDTENECGAGGCQQSVGDFLYHCHVAHHYFAGMWGIWRVYNTLQDGIADTDSLGLLPAVPGDAHPPVPAVSSDHLVDTQPPASGAPLTTGTVAAWVQRQLPPQGLPRGYDAAVMDWSVQDGIYRNEPETDRSWPGYQPAQPGTRPPILFDPRTGLLAYPFLRPHLGRRPPFAPNHGPAPYLDPTPTGADPPQPGADGPASVCPNGTRLTTLPINAITVPITVNGRADLVLPQGELYVLRSQEDAVKAQGGDALRQPLAIRANASQDCVDVLLRNELQDDSVNHGFAKVNLHIHFVQFDVQGSDGLDAGFNYEQSIRPFAVEGERLTFPVAAGATQATLGSAGRFQPGELVGVGMEQDATFETRTVTAVAGTTLTLDRPLAHDHTGGEIVSTEFVRYRWYPDVQFGTAYFHDHVNGLSSWSRGLFGALIAEPPDATYVDPHTGAPLASGPVADIHTKLPVAATVTGSFREGVLFMQDDNPINAVGRSSGSALNLRAEPLDQRGGPAPLLFSSQTHGDPETPVLQAYLGDPVVLRTLVAATNDVHTLHVDGHTFGLESSDARAPPVSTVHVGISERYDLAIGQAGGPGHLPGDYLFYDGRSFKLREGDWGLLRVLPPPGARPLGNDALHPLPGRALVAPASSVCPAGAPTRQFQVAAVDVALPMLAGVTPARTGRIYVLASDEAAVRSGAQAPEPLVLHVNVGDCIAFTLRNDTSAGPVSVHPDQLVADPATSAGVAAGREPDQSVAVGRSRTYTWYATPAVGTTTAMVRDWADVTHNPGLGLYGAVVVGPAGSRYTDPMTGRDVSGASAWAVDVHTPTDTYRDFSLFLQEEDAGIGTHRMPYTTAVDGTVGINYRATPFAGARPATATTPVLRAFARDPVRIHVLAPWAEQVQVFSVENHRWSLEPGVAGSTLVGSQALGPLEVLTLQLDGGAGGPLGVPGDYEYGDQRGPYREAGLWGRMLVLCPGTKGIQPLSGRSLPNRCADAGSRVRPLIGAVALIAVLAALVGAVARRRTHRRRPTTGT